MSFFSSLASIILSSFSREYRCWMRLRVSMLMYSFQGCCGCFACCDTNSTFVSTQYSYVRKPSVERFRWTCLFISSGCNLMSAALHRLSLWGACCFVVYTRLRWAIMGQWYMLRAVLMSVNVFRTTLAFLLLVSM